MAELLTIILAAGEGTRMRSAMPKVMHEVGGLPIVGHVVRAALGAGSSQVAVVTGPGHDSVRAAIDELAPGVHFFEQAERRGTAHAAGMARSLWQDAQGYVAVVYGDHPLLRGENFAGIVARLDAGWDAAILGFEPEDPTGYGRFITDGEQLLAIREHKDASAEERRIGLCNACILAFRADVFRSLIDQVQPNNAQRDRAQLARAEMLFQELRREDFMAAGVTLHDPKTVYFSWDTQIGPDVVIEPSVVFGPGVSVGEGAVIHAFCHIEGAEIGPKAAVGPFARLRPGTQLEEGAKAGNFVEIKKSRIGRGAKVNHLTYIGDADVGARANIGAGTVTCNYDGVNKSKTVIGPNTFIGSNSSLVAPVTIGEGAYVGSGSVITRNVEPDALALGRGRQENKLGYATKLKARADAIKQARSKE